MQSIKVSVIMPVYNTGKYLAQSLNCVINQTLRDIEIICIDDGSKDNSLEILRSFAKTDSRIIIIEQRNKGAGTARNAGLDIARGEYLSFLDADDLFEPNMLELAYKEAQCSSADFVLFDADIFDSESGRNLPSNWIINKAVLPNNDTFSADDIRCDIFTVCFHVAWNRLFSAKFIMDHQFRFQEIEKHNDAYFAVMTMMHAKCIRYVDSILLHYRKGTQVQISSSPFGRKEYWPILDALIAIQDEIQSMCSYDIMFKSFLNYSSNLILAAFERINQEDYFKVFSLLKEKWLTRLPKQAFREEYFKIYHEYRQMKSISDNDAIGHLFTLLEIRNERIDDLKKNKRWVFPDRQISGGHDIVLYGAAEIGMDYYRQFNDSKTYNLIAWVDMNYLHCQQQGLPVSSPGDISHLKFDWIIITISHRSVANQIKQNLLKYGVSEEKIIWPFEDTP